MHRISHRIVPFAVLVLAATQLGYQCVPPASPPPDTSIAIVEPSGGQVDTCLESIAFQIDGAIRGKSLHAWLNGEELVVEPVGPGLFFRAAVAGRLAADNLLEVEAARYSDGAPITASLSFAHTPVLQAYRISDESDLIRGPLAHGRVGDWMLRNCTARFIIQDAPQRDLYSVGGFGGNLIDLELIAHPGLDNFIEIAPTLDVETVVNPQTVEIVNDGADGQPASIRSCGPDDLLDFINPSSQIQGIPGVQIPGHADDRDLPIEACTLYSLEPFASRVRMDTTVTNLGTISFPLLVGDWINPGGELENLFSPGDGPGSGLTADLGSIAWVGYGEAAGVDYSFTTIPITGNTTNLKGSFLNTSGVTLSLQTIGVLQAITGTNSPFLVAPGASRTYTRYLGVGDGSASNAIDMANDVKHDPIATVQGCVTSGGAAPAEGARVVVGTLDGGAIGAVQTLFTTGADGCYAGSVPPTPTGAQYAMAAALIGSPYEGGGVQPVLHPFTVADGDVETLPTVDLPATGQLRVNVVDEYGRALPARVSVVGFDPSPEPIIPGGSLFGLSVGDIGLFRDPTDSHPYGIVSAHYADAQGKVAFPVEPGTYEVYVSRGPEYSLFHERRTVATGVNTIVNAQLARVVDTAGFISSDFHVHGIRSADSRVSDTDRAMQFAGEGVDNIIMTDHHVHTDLKPRIAALGLSPFVTATVGEEITTFDYGHFNGYPFSIDPTRPSGGSTDWAQAAPAGMDFPQYGNLNATPAQIHALAVTGAQALPSTVVQVNHIGSHFTPLKIDTAATTIQDALSVAERAALRLPATGNLFHVFDALELWNGESRGSQSNFLDERIGIWFNHLNHGIPITFIADTDTHQFFNLNSAGARTWTPSSSDAPQEIDPAEVGAAVAAGRAVGGQGIYVQTRLRAQDASGAVADFDLGGDTLVASANGDVDLEIDVQAPAWAAYDTIEIYANAATVPRDPANPYEYRAVPDLVLTAGADFTVDEIVIDPGVPGADRLETRGLVVPFRGLSEDTWFVVVVKGSDGISPPMFPVFPSNLDQTTNQNLDDLTDGNLGESGVMALGATNALYADVDGTPGFQRGP